ncbi:response regulator transcription factor [Clostridium cylindrosporum]|uniref:Stage 0 sporulation protein A homolog n=1 Tax=Clostridium cylindrosporum DSM 605 TaxID=1121307 RepID=A0A0J8D588_CLOCY|nr:response regulator transcription factor [Clostridium cylindrosporum]KMT20982.1 transcriptional regulatory protein ResD [Clostridium cylindrosporum DSM 605]
MRILVADDDERIVRLITDFLTHQGYIVESASNGEEALELFEKGTFDLIILDIMMPIYDGWVVCKEIRKTSNVPIIILTAKDSDLDELFGFEIGADDYVSKPFNIALLVARIKRLLKDSSSNKSQVIFKDIEIDLEKHIVKVGGIVTPLSPKEYELLVYFIQNLEKVISRDTLLRVIWSDDYFGDTRTVDTHINRLRNKLGNCSKYLKTVRSFGYKLGEC